MKTPYQLFGNEVRPGWRKIVQPLIDHCNANNIIILQIKEKFGGLRFYYQGGDDKFDAQVAEAERKSYNTCEECGEPGRLRQGGWFRTLCDYHANLEGYDDRDFEPSSDTTTVP